MRTFIGSIGARDSRDHSIAQLVSDRLRHDAPIAAAGIVVEDLSSDPAEIAERLINEWPPFERVIFVGSVLRSRPAGTAAAYRLNDESPVEDHGISESDDDVALENTLKAVRQMVDLPDDLIVVEVEPDQASGDEPSAAISLAFDRARALVRRLATNRRAAADLPRVALGDRVHEPRRLAD